MTGAKLEVKTAGRNPAPVASLTRTRGRLGKQPTGHARLAMAEGIASP
jgi:hypothetical protein